MSIRNIKKNNMKKIIKAIKIFFFITLLVIGLTATFGGFPILFEGCKMQWENPVPPEGSFINPNDTTLKENHKGFKQAFTGLAMITFGIILTGTTVICGKRVINTPK